MTGVILKSTNTTITFLPDNVSDTYDKPNTYDKAKWITLDLTTTDTTGLGGNKGVKLRELMEIDARTADRETYKVGTYGTVSYVTNFKYLGVVIFYSRTSRTSTLWKGKSEKRERSSIDTDLSSRGRVSTSRTGGSFTRV